MLNKFKIEFKELFFPYFFTEISNSCFSRNFIKVYTVMVSLKRHKKSRFARFARYEVIFLNIVKFQHSFAFVCYLVVTS